MTFDTCPPEIVSEYRDVDFYITNSSISNHYGELLAYTNGYCIANAWNDTMQGGESINNLDYNVYQDVLPQGTLFLPQPGNDSIFYLFHEQSFLDPTTVPYSFVLLAQYSIINVYANNGRGKVIKANIPLLEDTLCYGKLTAAKHGNGRDWWVIIPAFNKPKYYKYLLTPHGIDTFPPQVIGNARLSGLGQAVFSPDGTKYASMNNLGYDYGCWIEILDFNRCSGWFTNYTGIKKDSISTFGLCISPNSRLLYFSTGEFLFQYDLWSDNIESSELVIAEYDGFANPLPTIFGMSQLAPDGKIYVSSNWNVKNYHIIHYPNLVGDNCHVDQHAYHVPRLTSKSIPTFPYYRLGPLDGSSCDTLGIDNWPIADFRTDETIDSFRVDFTDLSYYNTDTWHWDFGDGGQSDEQNPSHTFEMPGEYLVCLVASNMYAADTVCKVVKVGGVVSANYIYPEQTQKIALHPNPAKEEIHITLQGRRLNSVTIYSQMGQVVTSHSAVEPSSEIIIPIGRLATGMYTVVVHDNAGRFYQSIFVKM